MTAPMATIGVISIGEMGLGIAKLLKASGYRVITNATGRRHAIHDISREVGTASNLEKQSRHT